jgi:hypothetical protein
MSSLKNMRVCQHTEFLKHLDVADESIGVFQEIIYTAFCFYCFNRAQCAREIGVSRSAITKWCSKDAVPNKPTRDVVREWIVTQCKK